MADQDKIIIRKYQEGDEYQIVVCLNMRALNNCHGYYLARFEEL
jgi:hypothetical protein